MFHTVSDDSTSSFELLKYKPSPPTSLELLQKDESLKIDGSKIEENVDHTPPSSSSSQLAIPIIPNSHGKSGNSSHPTTLQQEFSMLNATMESEQFNSIEVMVSIIFI